MGIEYRVAEVYLGDTDFEEALKRLITIGETIIDFKRVIEDCMPRAQYRAIENLANAVMMSILSIGKEAKSEKVSFCSTVKGLEALQDQIAVLLGSIMMGELALMGKEELAEALRKDVERGDTVELLMKSISIAKQVLQDVSKQV